MTGLVIKKLPTLFVVQAEKEYFCQARGNLKKQGVFVGDKVEFDEKDEIIEKILPRKNCLIRPPLANLDRMFIVISPKPKPDYELIDKLILFCIVNDVKPILCVNKIDEDEKFAEQVEEIYGKSFEIVLCSAKINLTDALKDKIEGICTFAGQSAVGKSSLINSIFGKEFEEVGDFGKKIERGKQTTRLVTLYPFNGSYIADTAGFSQLDEKYLDIDYHELSRYYPDFMPYVNECKYQSCMHTHPNDCAVIKAVKENKINKQRYENYLKLLSSKKNEKKY